MWHELGEPPSDENLTLNVPYHGAVLHVQKSSKVAIQLSHSAMHWNEVTRKWENIHDDGVRDAENANATYIVAPWCGFVSQASGRCFHSCWMGPLVGC